MSLAGPTRISTKALDELYVIADQVQFQGRSESQLQSEFYLWRQTGTLCSLVVKICQGPTRLVLFWHKDPSFALVLVEEVNPLHLHILRQSFLV